MEDALVVFSSAYVLLQPLHALRNVVGGELPGADVVVVDVAHAELGLQVHLPGEQLHELSQDVFMVVRSRLVYKHNAVGVLLDGAPAFFLAKVSGDVPKFKLALTEGGHRRRRISLQVNNSTDDNVSKEN